MNFIGKYFIDIYILNMERENDTEMEEDWKAGSHMAQTGIELTM